jgi:tetratricopeptide (TPR) repeat protein
MAKGNYDKAIADFSEDIRLDPKHAEAHYNRGLAYRSRGNGSKAKDDFAEAKRLGYSPEKMAK